MFWFSGICNDTSNKKTIEYIQMYFVALVTAKKTNPKLRPVLIVDGVIDENIKKIERSGALIIQHQFPLIEDIKKASNNNGTLTAARGAFLRIDICKICEQIGIMDDFCFYTDNDVMFLGDISSIFDYKPNFFLVAGEFDKTFDANISNFNSGVMFINKKTMQNTYNDFLIFTKENIHNSMSKGFDQFCFRSFYAGNAELLHYLYNYKPYWGNEDNIKIIHFHGIKPFDSDADILSMQPVIRNLATPFFYEMRFLFFENLKLWKDA